MVELYMDKLLDLMVIDQEGQKAVRPKLEIRED